MREWCESRRFHYVVEAGCGTGKNTVVLAARSDEVHALDFSPGMLEQARAKVGGAPHVRLSQADLTSRWPIAEVGADLVTFNLVLEHIERLEVVLAEAARVLRPRGTVRVSELHPFRQYRGTQARFGRPDGSVTRIPAFVHHVSDYIRAAESVGLTLRRLDERWHETDSGEPPRLLVLEFQRS